MAFFSAIGLKSYEEMGRGHGSHYCQNGAQRRGYSVEFRLVEGNGLFCCTQRPVTAPCVFSVRDKSGVALRLPPQSKKGCHFWERAGNHRVNRFVSVETVTMRQFLGESSRILISHPVATALLAFAVARRRRAGR